MAWYGTLAPGSPIVTNVNFPTIRQTASFSNTSATTRPWVANFPMACLAGSTIYTVVSFPNGNALSLIPWNPSVYDNIVGSGAPYTQIGEFDFSATAGQSIAHYASQGIAGGQTSVTLTSTNNDGNHTTLASIGIQAFEIVGTSILDPGTGGSPGFRVTSVAGGNGTPLVLGTIKNFYSPSLSISLVMSATTTTGPTANPNGIPQIFGGTIWPFPSSIAIACWGYETFVTSATVYQPGYFSPASATYLYTESFFA